MSELVGYQKAIERNKVIMLAPAGSELLGLKQEENSDRDEMGICLETDAQLIGFSPFEQDIYRSAEEREEKKNVKSKAGDIDLVLYGLRKFVRLALSGNPNLMSMLFIPKKLCPVYTDIAKELQAMAPDFVSKSTAKAFLGYMKSQRMRLMGLRGQKNVNRSALEQELGFDTKYAMHLIRLGIQGELLVRERSMFFPLEPGYRDYLQLIRIGGVSYPQVVKDAQRYENTIEETLNSSALPEFPETTKIESWMLNVYRKAWRET